MNPSDTEDSPQDAWRDSLVADSLRKLKEAAANERELINNQHHHKFSQWNLKCECGLTMKDYDSHTFDEKSKLPICPLARGNHERPSE